MRLSDADDTHDGLDVQIISGGELTAIERAVIVTSVSRLIADRASDHAERPPAWALAGRLEASGATTIRWRGALPLRTD